jgi:adenine-specific DNA-methyltransferase
LSKPALSYQKLRGGYYTPKPIADFLARWAIQSPKAEVLEPSCGDGVLLQSAFEALIEKGAKQKKVAELLHGVEIDEHEGRKAISRLEALGAKPSMFLIHTGDFFAYCKAHLNDKRLFDAVIGNPPFIRYQNFIEEQRIPAFELMSQADMKPNRLTNTWVPFIVASSFLLNDKGRLAMVIPAELLQVNYAAHLRRFLSDYYNKITLITFKKLVFEGIQQEVVLLLGERNGDGRTGIRTIELENVSCLASYEHTDFINSELKPMDHSTEKWTQYFLSKDEIKLLRALRANAALTEAGKVIDVDVGIVTGQNQFFVLSDEQIKERRLINHALPIVGRSGHLKGAIFSEADWRANADANLPAHLLNLPNVPFDELPTAAREYVARGEEAGLHTGFKCRIRNRWYIVPSVWTPDAFMLRQVHGYPKIIVNQTKATCTDTIHRVRLLNGTNGDLIAAAFLNSLTFAFSEVIGRSYGGGVLELEPNEAEKLPLPLKGAERLDIKQLHKLLLKDDIDAVLDITDKVLLIDGLGLTDKEAKMLRWIWQKLRDRRINRKRSGKRIDAVPEVEKSPHKSPHSSL